MQKKYLTGIIAVSAILLLGISAVSAFGFGNGFGLNANKEEMRQQQESIREAVGNNDYEAWKSLMQERVNMMQNEISQENFNKMVERHAERAEFQAKMEEAREAGDFERMQELRGQYGFGEKGNGKGKGFGLGKAGKCPLAE